MSVTWAFLATAALTYVKARVRGDLSVKRTSQSQIHIYTHTIEPSTMLLTIETGMCSHGTAAAAAAMGRSFLRPIIRSVVHSQLRPNEREDAVSVLWLLDRSWWIYIALNSVYFMWPWGTGACLTGPVSGLSPPLFPLCQLQRRETLLCRCTNERRERKTSKFMLQLPLKVT